MIKCGASGCTNLHLKGKNYHNIVCVLTCRNSIGECRPMCNRHDIFIMQARGFRGVDKLCPKRHKSRENITDRTMYSYSRFFVPAECID